MDEWLLDEFSDIEKRISALDKRCEKMDLELRATKEILYLILENIATNHTFEIGKECEDKLMSKDIGIISLNKRACIEWVRQKVEQKGGKIKVIDEAVSAGDLASHLNQLCNGESVFINCVYINDSNKKLYELLQRAITRKCVEVHIGGGDSARTIVIALPDINYILYAPEERLFLPDLIADENIFTDNR